MNDRLWYQEPATQWMDGLPIGTGRLAAMVLGDGADLSTRKLLNDKLILDMTPYWNKDKDFQARAKWFPFVLQQSRIDGKLVGAPYNWFTHGGLGYDADRFSQAGVAYPDPSWTWDTAAEMAKKLNKVESDKLVQSGFRAEDFGWLIVSDMLHSAEAPIYNDAQTAMVLNNARALRVLGRVQSWVTSNVAPQPAGRGAGYQRAMWPAAAHWVLPSKPEWKVKYEPGYGAQPVDPDSGLRRSRVGVSINGVNVNTKHPDAAWAFITCFSDNFAQVSAEKTGYVQMFPVSSRDISLYVNANPAVLGTQLVKDLQRAMNSLIDAAHVLPPVANPLVELNGVGINSAIGGEWGKVIKGQQPVAAFVTNVTQKVNALLQAKK